MAYTNSPDLFKLPSPAATPRLSKLASAAVLENSPDFPTLDPATQDLIARTNKLLKGTIHDTGSPQLSAIPDSPFSTPMIKAATSRTKYGLPSVARVVAASASKNSKFTAPDPMEDITQSPDFSIEPPAPAPSQYVSSSILNGYKGLQFGKPNVAAAPMRDSTNAPPPMSASTQNIISMIMGKKSTMNEPVAPVSSTILSEMPSPPKASFEQENDWHSSNAVDGEATIRFSGRRGQVHRNVLDDDAQFQMPSPMKVGGPEEVESQHDDEVHYQAAPTMTFKLSRADMPDDDDLNESIAERTITKLNPNMIPPLSAVASAAHARPQLIQIPSRFQAQFQQNHSSVQQVPAPLDRSQAQKPYQDDSFQNLTIDSTLAPATYQSPDETLQPEQQNQIINDDNSSNGNIGSPQKDDGAPSQSIIYDAEQTLATEETHQNLEQESPQNQSLEELPVKADEEQFGAEQDEDIASRIVRSVFLQCDLPLKEAIMSTLLFERPGMPEELRRAAAIFNVSQFIKVINGVSAEELNAGLRVLVQSNKIERVNLKTKQSSDSEAYYRVKMQ